MYKIKALFIYVLIITVSLPSCMKYEDPKTEERTVPFKGTYYTSSADDAAVSEECGPNIGENDFWLREHQMGEGNATYMGNSTVDFKFCIHIVWDENGAPDIDNGFGNYNDIDPTILVAANGDKLYMQAVKNENSIELSDNPDYQFMFDNDHNIIGGTGRFEGVTGMVKGMSYIKDGRVKHTWEGKMTFPTGN